MIKILPFLLAALFLCMCSNAQQLLPKEGSTLNYRIIGFTMPMEKGATDCKLQIAYGNFTTDDQFSKNIGNSVDSKTNRIIAEVPLFGKDYTWRFVFTGPKTKVVNSELYHFHVGTCPEVDSTYTRLRIVKPAQKYQNDYVFVDANKTLNDMQGNPVWYLPPIEGNFSFTCRDFYITPQNTLSFMILFNGIYDGCNQ